jgi:glycosyltransferase involved in cell wall biosynthesis
MRNQLAIVMPVFNESEGIRDFVSEIRNEFNKIRPVILIVDDCSTDETWNVLQEMKAQANDLIIHRNILNLGHGRTTVEAMNYGIINHANYIMTVDGDGQFIGKEMFDFFKEFYDSNTNYGEGRRVLREDPWFRRVISLVTRLLVLVKTGKRIADANTPCRIYERETLQSLLSKIDGNSMVPNLAISIVARKEHMQVFNFSLTNIPRRGESVQGSTWGAKKTRLPNKKLVKFCLNAIKEFF